jgi:hypothetical protein
MQISHGVAVWVLGSLALLFVLGKLFASVNLSLGK